MQLTQTLAREIKDYIKSLLDKDVVILDSTSRCISSPEIEEIDKEMTLPLPPFQYIEPTVVDFDGKHEVLIPLQYQSETVAILLLREDFNKIKNYTLLIKSFAELLIQQYYENHKPILDTTDQFMSKLLFNAQPLDYPLYESEARVLGYDLSVQRLAIVIRLKGFWEKCLLSLDEPSYEREEIIKNWKKNIENEINGFFTKSTDNIVAYLGSDKFIIFKSVDTQSQENTIKLLKQSHKSIFEPLNKFQISSITVGFGNASSGIKGLIDSFREADTALEFGQRLWGDNKSYYFGDLGVLSIIADGNNDKKIIFAQNILGPLTNQDLTKTLESFFDNNLNLTETASSMKIHRNTVIYRLNQIAEILDADPRIFEQAMTIKTALLIKNLLG